MIDSASAVPARARAVIRPAHPRRTAKGSRAGCPGGRGWHLGWRSGAAERVNRTHPPAGAWNQSSSPAATRAPAKDLFVDTLHAVQHLLEGESLPESLSRRCAHPATCGGIGD
jgi:hypothetical protein